ncbi:L-histidine N(alpha)-methyltransferase, partial [Rhodococcus sp. YH1]|uniref:L-histidine N(alpha)-methyltransferase n=1 Tax=Rhodococcus sp. YH1 TaxID=89066 RepID=UPI001EE4712A
MTVDVYLTPEQLDESLRADARRGLTSSPKWLSPTWLYDARGGELFDRITRLPEYYPTRTERALLQKHSPELADEARPEMLVELGSGSSEKTEILLDALQPYIHTYVPQDVSEAALQPAVTRLSAEIHAGRAFAAEVGDGLGDPIGSVLRTRGDVGERALRSGDHEHVR